LNNTTEETEKDKLIGKMINRRENRSYSVVKTVGVCRIYVFIGF
jgi:hypothetical protein